MVQNQCPHILPLLFVCRVLHTRQYSRLSQRLLGFLLTYSFAEPFTKQNLKLDAKDQIYTRVQLDVGLRLLLSQF